VGHTARDAGCQNRGMDSIVLLCTDGSDASIEALRVSLPLLAPADRTIVVTVESPMDPTHTTGRGFTATSSADARIETDGDGVAKQALDRTVAELGLEEVELIAVVGSTGPAICGLAAELPASIVVVGTSGKSGLRRAVLGSTSDYVVRHAVCPVLVQGVGAN
jgi:nucleotide-binding universal stress UspA family protein